MDAISAWYPGHVTSVTALRPGSVIKDEAIPALVRHLFRLPEFRTRALRMGKVVCLTPKRVEYYEADRRVRSLSWSAS
jgi:hypothetical protein